MILTFFSLMFKHLKKIAIEAVEVDYEISLPENSLDQAGPLLKVF